MGGVADSQTGPKPPNHPKNASVEPNVTFCVPKSHKKPVVGGWVSHTWENFPKKKRFVLGPSFKYPVFTQPRKERKLEVTCSGEKELIQYMLVKPHLCHQVAYFYSFWTCHCLLIHNIFSKWKTSMPKPGKASCKCFFKVLIMLLLWLITS